jgi:hypothetical protein
MRFAFFGGIPVKALIDVGLEGVGQGYQQSYPHNLWTPRKAQENQRLNSFCSKLL